MGISDTTRRIESAYNKMWPRGDVAVREYLVAMIAEFANSKCCDKNFLSEFESGDPGKAASRTWEAMLYSRFSGCGWSVSGGGEGPDFRIDMGDGKGKVLVEAVACQPGDPCKNGLPQKWVGRKDGDVFHNIYDDMLPRWTSALKAKRDNHQKSLANADIPFVVAINDCRLGSAHGYHPCSGLPLAVHAVLPVGYPGILEDPETGKEISDWSLGWREGAPLRKGGAAPTDSFLNPDYACVSAIIGCSSVYESNDEWREVYCGQPQYVVVHNPLAKNPLPQPWLPGAVEYAAKIKEGGAFKLTCLTLPVIRPRSS